MTENTNIPEEDQEPTDKELLETRIEALRLLQEKDFNMWRQYAIESLEKELREGFGAEGESIDIPPANSGLLTQVSPPEVLSIPDSEEQFWTTFPQGLMGEPPQWLLDMDVDPAEGLKLFVARSNGCFGIYNQMATANRWIHNTDEAAAEYECSPRVLRVAGYSMRDRKYLLPTDDSIQNPYGRYGYALNPPVAPFNDEEKRIWRAMFTRYHFQIGASAPGAWLTHPLELDAAQHIPAERKRIDPDGRHLCVTVTNNPQFIVPALMGHFNTARFKTRAYAAALIICRDIDAGRRGRVPGYMTVEEMGGDFSDPFAWYGENESSDVTKAPVFRPGSDY